MTDRMASPIPERGRDEPGEINERRRKVGGEKKLYETDSDDLSSRTSSSNESDDEFTRKHRKGKARDYYCALNDPSRLGHADNLFMKFLTLHNNVSTNVATLSLNKRSSVVRQFLARTADLYILEHGLNWARVSDYFEDLYTRMGSLLLFDEFGSCTTGTPDVKYTNMFNKTLKKRASSLKLIKPSVLTSNETRKKQVSAPTHEASAVKPY